MRLHHLTVTAFGPFAGTEHVDFDELNDAGLFLLTGPTGAGKSSLLDAVCFALYGTVPGARGVKALRSQHADAQTQPEVRLDFGVQGRRFVVRRTPEWSRPKKRGTGALTEKASASITETTGGTEHFLSARAAEVGLLVTGLMGMNAAQFQQVALLPQGEFQTFLRATSQERHDVLQHLFRTDRFARIEDWVNDHSRLLKDRASTGEATVRRILDTVADRAGRDLPDDLVDDALAPGAVDGRVLPWVDDLVAGSQDDAAVARAAGEEVRRRLVGARRRHEAASRQAEQCARRATAARTLAVLEDTEDAARQGQAALAAHDRALLCRPVLSLHGQALRSRDVAAAGHDHAWGMLSPPAALLGLDVPLPDDPSDILLGELLDTVRSRVARLRALLPREQEAADAAARREADVSRLRSLEDDQREAATRAEQIPGVLARHSDELTAATTRTARQEAVAAALALARVRHDAAAELLDVQRRLDTLGDVRRDARDRVQDARERVQRLVARRLAGMAAELAGGLADGDACQVCGSLDHPRPAHPAHDAVSDDDQALAEAELSAAEVVLDSTELALAQVQSRCDTLTATAAGLSRGAAAAAIDELTVELEVSTKAQQQCDSLEREIQRLREEQGALGRRQVDAAAAAAGLRQSVRADERVLAAVAAELTDALGEGTDGRSVEDVVDDLSQLGELLVQAQRTRSELDDARARAAALAEQAQSTAVEHGFSTIDDVEHAVLPPDEHDRLSAALHERSVSQAAAQAILDDPALVEEGEADVAELAAGLAETEAAAAAAEGRLALHEDRARALALQRDRMTTALDDWAPVRDESLRADSMSRLVRGMGHDNQLQMRLSAYVLATRLDQVVAAANERLGHMRDQRYLLQRTGRAERRTSQAGLGLEIVDQWTGDVRAPSTLSGGETFVVSLSLALGLADVVTQESGGTEVETLFVDEGFGTLDADTLDDVMDRLDGLRAGGRTVGVVSHVTELRSRIPTQVQVEKGRTGSSVQVRTLVG